MLKKILILLSLSLLLVSCYSYPENAQFRALQVTVPDYLIISRNDLMALPTSGSAWDTLKSSADSNVTPNICDQNNKADVVALAAGIVYARTGQVSYQTKAINLINQVIGSQKDGCYNSVLAMGRQLGGYVLAADFAGYRDPSFVSWLTMILERDLGSHSRWHVMRYTAYDSASNWGVHALASVTVSDLYLGQTANIEKDWTVFSNYGVPHGWPFNKTSSFNEQWSCEATDSTGKLPVAINPPCIKSGINLDGAPVEDSSRSAFGSYSTYIHESLQGYVVMAQLWNMYGRAGWSVNSSQVCRATQFGNRAGRLNDSSVSYFVAHMANHFCGSSLPTKTPTNGGRMFGFSDWLFQGSTPPVVTATNTVAVSKTPTKTQIPPTVTNTPVPPTVTRTPSLTPTVVISATVSRTPTVQPTLTFTVTPVCYPIFGGQEKKYIGDYCP